jgi:hypothetical protein
MNNEHASDDEMQIKIKLFTEKSNNKMLVKSKKALKASSEINLSFPGPFRV